MTVRVDVVPHTHWDREWYAPFESFRGRLVDLLDGLLPLLDADPGFTHFLLDGQLAVVDDYLAVRPEERPRLERLIKEGRVDVGPWYTLPDEFCVSGETLIRNLQLGMARAADVGGAMTVGYLPDMFGHVAQMPQILNAAGFQRAVVWRGVPNAVDKTRFRWSSPDGTTIDTEYLWHGYGNGSSLPQDGAALLERLRALADDVSTHRVGNLLVMNGTDHERPQPWLGRVVDEANALADDLEIRIVSLTEALAPPAPAGVPAWTGELRSGARANLLMGVLSNRVDIKQAAARAERTLERVAEPLCALYAAARTGADAHADDSWPQGLVDAAWLEMVRNAAHDSSCACSADDVCRAVAGRYASALHTAESLASKALGHLAARMAEPGLLIVNPTARPRGGVIELELPGNGPAGDTQLLSERPPTPEDRTLDNGDALAWLSRWRSQQFDAQSYINEVEIVDGDETVELTLHIGPRLITNLLIPSVARDIAENLGTRTLHVRAIQPAARRVACRVDDLPGFGWRRWEGTPSTPPPVRTDGHAMSNGLLTVTVDADGTFAIDGVDGFGRVVESGDDGDTYNYCPPDDDTVVTKPATVDIAVLESGPVRARIRVTSTYAWPERVVDHARSGVVETTMTTVVELQAGEPWVRVDHRWDNRSRDHRVRVLLPLVAPTDTSEAECAFAIVRRGLRAEGGPTERALATFPSRRFVRAGGITVVHDGLLEYELTDGRGEEITRDATTAEALALTMLRATGMLSRVDLPYRPLPAGPPLPLLDAQVQGPARARYAVSVDAGVDPYAMADEVLIPLRLTRAFGGGDVTAASGQALSITGAEVSALVRDRGALTVRLHNPTDAPVTATIAGWSGSIVDLTGRVQGSFLENITLGAWQIVTARIDGI